MTTGKLLTNSTASKFLQICFMKSNNQQTPAENSASENLQSIQSIL